MAEAHPDPDRVFAALADTRRRELLELLAGDPGASAGGLAALLPVSRQAVAQHLAVLEDACLVTRRRAGRQVLFTVRPEGLTATAGWLAARAAAWQARAAAPRQAGLSPNLSTDPRKDTLL
jgi:DNA-binding transcriptional ArsR family regulator